MRFMVCGFLQNLHALADVTVRPISPPAVSRVSVCEMFCRKRAFGKQRIGDTCQPKSHKMAPPAVVALRIVSIPPPLHTSCAPAIGLTAAWSPTRRASRFSIPGFAYSQSSVFAPRGSCGALCVSLLALSAGGWLFDSIVPGRIVGSLSRSRRPAVAASCLGGSLGRAVCVLAFGAG